METRGALGNVAANMGQILIVALVLAAAVGIGSALTQHFLNQPIDFNLVASLALAFGVIAAFLGIVFSLVLKRFP